MGVYGYILITIIKYQNIYRHKQLLLIVIIIQIYILCLNDFQLTIRIYKMLISLTSLQDRRHLQFGQAIS